jgi:hypothetical protein
MGLESALKSLKHTGYRQPENISIPPSFERKDLTLVRGIVKYVDLERFAMTCDILFTKDVAHDVPIAMPFAGPSSFISGMPEKGSMVILAKVQDVYFPIAYFPSYAFALDQKHINVWPDVVQEQENDFFYRHRSLRSGEINIGSSEGSELLLSYNAGLENSYGDNLLLRSSDHAIIATSLNNCIFSSGVWINAGVIQRNALRAANIKEGQYAREHVLRDGRVIYQLKPEDNNSLSKYYSEYLLEVEEHGSPELQSNSINDQIDLDRRSPIGVLSLGNFVGNNPFKENTYGKILGVSLFKSHDATEGGFNFVSLTKDEPERFGLAATLYKPEKNNYEQGAIFAIDKEGHFYQYIPAATGGGIGNGRSMSILAQGNKKEIWGADSIINNSWDMTLEGGLKWRIGKHNDSDYDLRSSSMDVVTRGKVYFQYGEDIARSIRDFDQPDKLVRNIDRYRKIEKVAGYERKEVTGSRETIIEGGDSYSIKGLKKESITGYYNTFVGGNRNINVGDTSSLNVTNEGQESFGNKTIKCTKGSHELTIVTVGDIKETINVRGNKSTNITSGNVLESIRVAGNKEFKTTTGNYKVNVLTRGNVIHKTAIGNIVGETKVGKMSLKSTLGMNLNTKAGVQVQGLKIKLKTPVPTGSVVTKLTSYCYITGVPNPGTPTIST